tara:strand:+ start:1293 stop:1553 length:261 start_codon:yes stop_codon:yes gene_type:complete
MILSKMTTLNLILVLVAVGLSAYNTLSMLAMNDRINSNEYGIKECASRTTRNATGINTIEVAVRHIENAVRKKKAGRPKKKTDGKQ